MELHERISSGGRPAASQQEPFADLKNKVHMAVISVLGRTPDVFIPSDREIPRTVNEGIPIVLARPQSEPAEAFERLTELLAGTAAPAEELVGAVAADGPSKRRLFGRKA